MNKKTKQNVEVLVIGGGASGMMAAGRAAELGKKVVLLEKNSALGEKLKITGGGRCNITNAEFDTRTLLAHYGEAAKFLYTPFSIFDVPDTFDFFESRGLPLIIEANKRAFPESQKALDVFKVLDNYIKEHHVEIRTNAPVEALTVKDHNITSVETSDVIYYPEKIIIATGGVSHPETGSTGDGFGWLRDMGHAVATPTPDIVPISIRESWIKKLSGRALDGVSIAFYCNDKKSFSEKGRVLCTHFGLSGPLILNSASKIRDLLHGGVVTTRIDLFPQTDHGALESQLIALFDQNKNKMLKNILPHFLPEGFTLVMPDILPDIDMDSQVNAITKEERKQIVDTLKSLTLTVKGLMGYDRAVVSDGGVLLTEIDMKTMQSKKCLNVHITGDLLHISRPSGGYSLQLCWTTGYIAGSSAAGQ